MDLSEDEDILKEFMDSNDWENIDNPKPDHLETLKRIFGHKDFRPLQWQIIRTILVDRKDVCAIMTTGYGKSLCYQYPSVYMGGVTLVISPLISLMEDQIMALEMLNIPAVLMGTAQNSKHDAIVGILNNKFSLVYLTPEFCMGETGQDLLTKMNDKLTVSLIAIDEAHCVSSWGHDFRLQYRQLGLLKTLLPDVPVLAVTATATPQVQHDIISSLKLKNPKIVCSGFDRPNLYLAAKLKGFDTFSDLQQLMQREKGIYKFSGPTIIYCITRKNTEKLSEMLQGHGISSLPYHAGLSLKVRKDTHEQFLKDKINVVVATIAFGMGIDKPDVRNIIHYGASNSLESYYQEVGRAGRDGLRSNCFAFYCDADFVTHKWLRENTVGPKNREQKERMANLMKEYLDTRSCRRRYILNHFEEKKVKDPIPKENCCDNCTRKHKQKVEDHEAYVGLDDENKFDFTNDAALFLSAVEHMKGYGLSALILFLRGSSNAKIKHFTKSPLYGKGKHKLEAWWKGVASLMELHKYTHKVQAFNTKFAAYTVQLTREGMSFLENVRNFPSSARFKAVPPPELFKLLEKKQVKTDDWLSVDSNVNPSMNKPSTSKIKMDEQEKETDEQIEARMSLYRLLMNKRSELATKHDCMPYLVASNTALMQMAKSKPINLSQLRKCNLDSFTEVKIIKFGIEFLKIVRVASGLNADIEEDKKTTKY